MHTDLRTALITNLDDKVPVSMMKQGPQVQRRTWSLTSGDHGEDEEGENDVTQDETIAMVQPLNRGKGKGKVQKERKQHVGTAVHMNTTAETARMTSRTAAGQMVDNEESERREGRQRRRQRMGHSQEQLEQLDGATGPQENTGSGTTSHESGRVSAGSTSGARQCLTGRNNMKRQW